MSLMYDEDYEISNSEEIENLLTELPFDLILANIKEQIEDPMSSNVNYIDTILEKVEICKSIIDDEDSRRSMTHSLNEFMSTIITEITKRFDLGLDIESIVMYDDVVEIGTVLYEYFILRYKKNISKYITNYIKQHKDELVDYYADKSKKDVTSLAHKKHVKDPNDLIIIANLPSIINFIVGLDISPYDFISLTARKSNYNASIIKNLITSDKMVGNFVHDYIRVGLDEHEYLFDEIQTDIKVRFLNIII